MICTLALYFMFNLSVNANTSKFLAFY